MAAILGILSSAATTPAVRSTTTLTLLLTALAGPRTAALSLSLPGGRWFRERGAVTQTRVAVLGGGFAGLTAARTLVASHPGVEVLLCDQREFFEYTPTKEDVQTKWEQKGTFGGLFLYMLKRYRVICDALMRTSFIRSQLNPNPYPFVYTIC